MPDSSRIEQPDDFEIDLQKLLETINQRIEYLYDRDHQIGHAYFIGITSKETLNDVMRNKVIPLLQEYFYDDWEKIQMILGDHPNQKADIQNKFIIETKTEEYSLFGFDHDDVDDERFVYEVASDFTSNAYVKIYKMNNAG